MKALLLCLVLTGCASDWTPEQSANFQQGMMNAAMILQMTNPPPPRQGIVSCSRIGNYLDCQQF